MVDGSGISQFFKLLKFRKMTSKIIDGRWIRDQPVWISVKVQSEDI
jgi:hypothetical protein